MTTDTRVRAARELRRFLDSDRVRSPGRLGAVLDGLRPVVPFDCANLIGWNDTTDHQTSLANLDYPADSLRDWESGLHHEPVFLELDAGTPAVRLRDIPVRERYRSSMYEQVIRPAGFTDGLTLRLWAPDGRYVGSLNTSVIGTSQPDDLALDLLDLLAPRLAAVLDPIPEPWSPTRELAEGRADGLLVSRTGRVRRLTGGADAGLARPDGPLGPLIHDVAHGRRPADSAVVLRGDQVVSVSLQALKNGVLVLHRTTEAPFGMSTRELQILDALACGATNTALAARFGIAVRTVATYVERLLVKTGCPNRTAASRLATRLNLRVW